MKDFLKHYAPALLSLSIMGLVGGMFLSFFGCSSQELFTAEEGGPLPEVVGFNAHIRPIFSKNCAMCHGGVKKSGGLSYVFEEEAKKIGLSGNMSIVEGDPDASQLIKKITSTDPKFRMPPPEHGPAMTPRQIALFKKWIKQGAPWEEHWVFNPVATVAVPKSESAWPKNEMDQFILARLESEGLKPNLKAEKGTLLRRLSLDLTGLPPTEKELEAFLANDAADAYEQEVERLLASSHYGERWATMWLDLARYADSKGLGQDAKRPTVYKYRDWVIRALNDDMSFKDFSIKQIAGDLLPEPSLDDFVATVFHRNSQVEDEGGTNNEEFRTVAVMDRVNTTWQAWHGTTFGCVQCHSHPYDPFRHKEYYQFLAFFNNAMDSDTAHDFPHLSVPVSEEDQAEVNALSGEREQLVRKNWQTHFDLAQQSAWTWLHHMQVTNNHAYQMGFDVIEREGREEFVFHGTPRSHEMQVEASVPLASTTVQAIRFDVLPLDLGRAPFQPSSGFLIENFKLEHLPKGSDKPVHYAFDRIYQDEPFPFDWANPGPKTGNTGFAARTKIFKLRHAVFRLKNPLSLAEGDRLRLTIKQGIRSSTDIMMARRGSFGVSDDLRWRNFEDEASWKESKGRIGHLNHLIHKAGKVAVPIIREREPHIARQTKIFVRGNWTDLGDEVQPSTPASLHPLSDGDEPARLKLGRWLVDEKNPMTARVLVSRIWEQLFGVGIVETLEDFGSVGELPSHPELLDYLALKFIHDFDWSLKSLVREIVSSAAYRQSGQSTPVLSELDPKNRLLARGPRNRLTGEMVRDQVLRLGGILNDKMYGPAIMPELPEGGWAPAHSVAGEWKVSKGDEQLRRSVYVHWQRSSVYPLFEAFDAPARDVCSDRRIVSNTPLQPLFTLNDPALFQATQAFGKRMRSYEGSTAEQISYGYRLATCSEIPTNILEELEILHSKIQEAFPAEDEGMQARHNAENDKKLKALKAEATQKRKKLIADARKKFEKEKPQREKARAARKKEAEEALAKAQTANTNETATVVTAVEEEPEEVFENPADLPDPETITLGPASDYAYDAEQAALDTVASVIMNLDEVLTK